MSFSDENLIFLISQQRAGSTLLQRMLGTHSEIHTTAEPWLMLHPMYALRDSGHEAEYNAVIAHKALSDFLQTLDGGVANYHFALRQMALSLYGAAAREAGKPYFLDKTPRYFFIIEDLLTVFPEARFIFLLRNPLAVFSSILDTWVKEHWVLLGRYKADLLLAPHHILEGIVQAGTRGSVVHYEALVQQPEDELQRLCDFLGLSYHPEMIEYGAGGRPAGDLGDPTQIEKNKRPTTRSMEKWHRLVTDAQSHHLARAYLDDLGPTVVNELGYDFDSMQSFLRDTGAARGSGAVGWKELMYPDHRQQLRQRNVELALLTYRRLIHRLKAWLERIIR